MRLNVLVCVGLLLNTALASAGGLTVQPEAENVTAGHLEGIWRPKTEFNQHFLTQVQKDVDTITFVKDDTVAGSVPEQYVQMFLEKQITAYLSGYFTLVSGERTVRAPFVLTSLHGNPHVVFWLERGGDPYGNAESFNLMLAASDVRGRDVLFMGGDHASESFVAFERIPAEKVNPQTE